MSYQNSKKPHSKPSVYINLNSFNYISQPVDSLDALLQNQWDIMSLEISSHGNNGVLFIQTTIGSFVLKMNNQAPSDIFFNTFAQLIDVNVPQVKIIACYQDFFQLLTFKIQQFCQKDEQLSARLRKRMDFPFYQLMQYIPSVSFLQVGRQRYVRHLSNETKLQQIGKCIGFDMLINNSDRFKLNKIWSNLSEGNVANVLIQVQQHYMHHLQRIKDRQQLQIKLGQYWFIDHGGFMLDIEKNKLAADNFYKYMQKICMFHQQMIQFIRGQLPLPQQFDGLITQIQFYTKYKLNQEQLTYIIEGIIYSTNMFISCFEEGAFQQILFNLKRQNILQKRQQVKYWDQYWNSDLSKIKLKHLSIYHLKVSAIYATYNQVIQTICNKVAKNINQVKSKRKNHHRRKSSYLRRNNKTFSNKNQQLSKQKQPPKIDLDFLNDSKNDEIQKEQLYQMDQKQKQMLRKQQQRLLKQQLARKRFKQRLQAFQKQNY